MENGNDRNRRDKREKIWRRHQNKLHHRHRLVGIDFSPRHTQNSQCTRGELLRLDETQSEPLTYEIKQRDLTSISRRSHNTG